MYLRMAVMLLLSLFTSRVIFNTLGITDYGTYNVVAGVIVFFSFLNNGLSIATKRYITAEIGLENSENEKKVFNTCVLSHILIAIIILFLAEGVGLWIVNNVLSIPENRLYAANIVYQFSILSALISIIQSPFMCMIVAYERMNIFAYFTVLDSIIKLAIIYLIQLMVGDKLILYSLLLFASSIISFIFVYLYCYTRIPSSHWAFYKDKQLLRNIFAFTSWSLLGQVAVVGTNQGCTILINVFFGVAVNAALGISDTVVNAINGFVTNFQTAFNPQIIKSYISNDWTYLQNLIVRSAKISSFLISLFLIPVFFELPYILTIWLGQYPVYTVEFCRCALICIFIEAVSAPLWMVIYSQTRVRNYQIIISAVYSLCFFLSWFLLLFHIFPPYIILIVRMFVFFMLMFLRLFFVKLYFSKLDMNSWFYNVFLRSLSIVSLIGGIVYLIIHFVYIENILVHVSMIVLLSLIMTCFAFILFVFDKTERMYMYNLICVNLKKLNK